MKKFYALIATAAVMASSFSANAYERATRLSGDAVKVVTEQKIAPAATNLKAAPTAPVRALSRAEEAPDIFGTNLIFFDEYGGEKGHYMSTTEILPGEGEGQIILRNFIFDGVPDIPATLDYKVFQDGSGAWLVTIKGNGQVPFITFNDGNESFLYLMATDPEDGNQYIYIDDIQFIILEGNEMLYIYEDAGIGWFYPSGNQFRGNWIWNPAMYTANASQETLAIDPETEEFEEAEFDVWTYKYYDVLDDGTEVNALFVRGFCGIYETFYFLVYPEIMMGAAYDQVAVTLDQYGDFYVTDGSDPTSDYDYILPIQFEEVDGNTVFTVVTDDDGVWYIANELDWFDAFAETVTTLNYNFFTGNGVSSAVVDSEDAAPVYYNLQGIQVANPEAGKLYIVKKGNHTSKVIR